MFSSSTYTFNLIRSILSFQLWLDSIHCDLLVKWICDVAYYWTMNCLKSLYVVFLLILSHFIPFRKKRRLLWNVLSEFLFRWGNWGHRKCQCNWQNSDFTFNSVFKVFSFVSLFYLSEITNGKLIKEIRMNFWEDC